LRHFDRGLPHTATHETRCNTLQHTATHCKTLPNTAPHNTPQYTAAHYKKTATQTRVEGLIIVGAIRANLTGDFLLPTRPRTPLRSRVCLELFAESHLGGPKIFFLAPLSLCTLLFFFLTLLRRVLLLLALSGVCRRGRLVVRKVLDLVVGFSRQTHANVRTHAHTHTYGLENTKFSRGAATHTHTHTHAHAHTHTRTHAHTHTRTHAYTHGWWYARCCI